MNTKRSISPTWDGDVMVHRLNEGGKVTTTRVPADVFHIDFSCRHPVPQGAMLLEDFLDEFDAQADVQEVLPQARQEVGLELADGKALQLKHLRLAKGLSQKDLAVAIGSTQGKISMIEARKQKPGEDTLRALSDVLEVDFNTLMEALANG